MAASAINIDVGRAKRSHIGKIYWAGEMAAIGLLAGSAPAPASAADKVIVGLITKTNTNPVFAKMKDGAVAKAKELDVDLRTYAGKYDGDNESLTEIFGSPPSSVCTSSFRGRSSWPTIPVKYAGYAPIP
jgi:hypothetical protein